MVFVYDKIKHIVIGEGIYTIFNFTAKEQG